MSHVPHELAEEFPQDAARISLLKAEDAHFCGLAEQYHQINREVHRAETNVEPTSDVHMLELRRKRLVLKDQIAGYLAKSAS
ncbi:YdcH family protein [Jannaschia sp. M317]|uniref:YdcH family protein n=1 Tax=Jannaschia sp. M317 TaxID=2867011 RepID=UPI0021A4E23E|nr:DUF465 domain-containing protein [Jannaschia sp. M317]UWQ19138.1 DUF465 domain-containing protein [Jannaschia sp. M317]